MSSVRTQGRQEKNNVHQCCENSLAEDFSTCQLTDTMSLIPNNHVQAVYAATPTFRDIPRALQADVLKHFVISYVLSGECAQNVKEAFFYAFLQDILKYSDLPSSFQAYTQQDFAIFPYTFQTDILKYSIIVVRLSRRIFRNTG